MRSRSQFSAPLLSTLLLTSVLSSGLAAQDLSIREVVWGFDGRLTPCNFNIVSVLLDNPNEDAFEGSITLRHRTGTAQPVGAVMVEEDIYIEPLGTRWVQFVPYIGQFPDAGTWRLSYRPQDRTKPGGTETLPTVNAGRDAIVFLSRSGGFTSSARGVRHFREEIFPTSVAGTSGLKSVVLNHVPRWEQPRRQAFSDWLHLGGCVHLLLSDEGEYPMFSDELAVLNNPLDRQRVGSGVVFRHNVNASAIDSNFGKRLRAMENAFAQIPEEGSDEALNSALEAVQSSQYGLDPYSTFNHGPWPKSEAFHSRLMKMTQPDHNWPLIYFLSLCYILIIFPGCYLVGKRRSHYAVTYGAILGAALVFSLAFLIVGRRGYGEQAAVNAVAVAQRIDENRWDVMQWSNAFVTQGDSYQVVHSGRGVAYATGQQSEPVNGVIAKRRREDGYVERIFQVDIPPFSSRPFVHRQSLVLPGLTARVTELQISDQIDSLRVQVSEDFPIGPDHLCYVVHGNTVYAMSPGTEPQELVRTSRLGTVGQFIKPETLTSWAGVDIWYDRDESTPEESYEAMLHTAFGHLFGLMEKTDFVSARIPPDRVRLLVYTRMPEQMFVVGNELTNQRGYVLYSQDLPIEVTEQ